MSRRPPRARRTTTSRSSQTTVLIAVAVLLAAYYLYQEFRGSGQQPAAEPTPAGATAVAGGPAAQPTPQSGGADWYQLFFTTPRYPDKPEYHHGGIDEQLVAFIGTAQQTIDLADYDFDLENVASALAQASARGVRVRMVTDTDTLTNDDPKVQKAFGILKKAKIPIVDDQRPAIMHNKFLVVDNAAVWTGSWNFTDGDAYRLNNNAIRIASPGLAQNYSAEFEKMFVGRNFGPSKPAGVPNPVLTIGGVRVENYFAPEDKVAAKVSQRIARARQSIHFLAFSFTNDTIGQAVVDRAKAGVEVKGVFETTGSETKFSEFGPMKQAGIDVLQDGNPYVMHHKVFILDGRTVIFGSFNFRENADKDNDENLLIVDDPALAQAFEAEFQRVREVALNPPKKK